MARIIRINNCKECPSRDHKGGFGKPAYVPVCRNVQRELPYTVALNGLMVVARQNEGIPDWCPLETNDAAWCETGMTPRQLQARIAELTAPPTPDSSGVVSDEDLARAFAGTNFGTDKHRELLHRGVLKKAGQYHCGHTITTIMSELGLIRTTGALTKKGAAMLRIAYHQQMIGGV